MAFTRRFSFLLPICHKSRFTAFFTGILLFHASRSINSKKKDEFIRFFLVMNSKTAHQFKIAAFNELTLIISILANLINCEWRLRQKYIPTIANIPRFRFRYPNIKLLSWYLIVLCHLWSQQMCFMNIGFMKFHSRLMLLPNLVSWFSDVWYSLTIRFVKMNSNSAHLVSKIFIRECVQFFKNLIYSYFWTYFK